MIIVVEIGVSKWWWGVWLFRAEAEKVWQGIKVSKEGRVPQGRFPRIDGSMDRWIDGSMDRWIDGSMDHFNFKSLKTNRSPQLDAIARSYSKLTGKPEQQATLPHAAVSNQQKLEEVIIFRAHF